MSDSSRLLVISLYGVPEGERRVLEDTLGPLDRYVLVDEHDNLVPDILIADKRNIAALERAHEMSRRTGGRPLVMISRVGDNRDRWTLPRPLTAPRILSQLAQVQREMRVPRRSRNGVDGPLPPVSGNSRGVTQRRSEPPTLKVLRALVVDDSALARHQVVEALARCGIEPDIAADADEAEGMVAEKVYDLLFFDARLGGTEGYQICRDVARMRAGRETPVVMLTGRSKGFDAMRGKLWGCEWALSKPVQATEIRQVLHELDSAASSDAPAA